MRFVKCGKCRNKFNSESSLCTYCGAVKGSGGGGILLVLALVLVPYFLFLKFHSAPIDAALNAPHRETDSEKAQKAMPAVKLKTRWSKEGFGNVMMADFTITNNSSYFISDIFISCHMMGKSGTEIGTNANIIYDSVEPGKTKKIKEFDMGLINPQAASSNCEISDLKAY